MVDVTYEGSRGPVEIEVGFMRFVVVKPGETVSVPDKIAKGDPSAGLGGLLDQTDAWSEAKKQTDPKPKP